MSTLSADRRDDVVRLLADVPDGLSDGDLARALGDGIRPQTVNTLCRRMVAAGLVERIGTRPIRNRLVASEAASVLASPADTDSTADTPPAQASPPDSPTGEDTLAAESPRDSDPATDTAPEEAGPADTDSTADTPSAQASPADTDSTADTPSAQASPPDSPAVEDSRSAGSRRRDTRVNGAAAPDPAAARPRPAHDALQAWSRTVNVQAAVARWLDARGATIRSATLDGNAAARDLVARLDGDELHVEVTGWPPDGDRTHPTTIAADWFSAAARAAVRRRGVQPHARIVIALPDTRRYRALAAKDAALAGARTEVWFVGPTGAVDPG